MKVTILTFQFAHNYGALLQAFALKEYVKSQEYETTIVPFYPEWAKAEYAVSPLTTGISFRKKIRLALQYSKRKKLSTAFETFISKELSIGETFSTETQLIKWLDENDCVICGSDQIWNNLITRDSSAYFADGSKTKKISYAASLGTIRLTASQRKNVCKYLPEFKAISVREPSSAVFIEKVLNRKIQVVLDPVFLLDAFEWKKYESEVNIKTPYMLMYFLQENKKLRHYAREYARKKGLLIYEIHPTMLNMHRGCIRLENIGPKEFLWLVHNAACVCTNSFHATAFSVIFERKLIHIPNSDSPERTIALLERVNISIKQDGEFPVYDLSEVDKSRLLSEINESKKFLECLKEME